MKAEWIDNGPSMWAEMGLQSSKKWICQQQSKLRKIPKILCGLTCASSSRACTCVCPVQHARTRYLMHAPHTSTADYVVLSSRRFIRLRLWCGIPWSGRNTVPGKETEWICTLRSSGRGLPLIPLASLGLCLACVCCVQSLAPSLHLLLQHPSALPPPSITAVFSPPFRRRSLFRELYTLFLQPTPGPHLN